MGETQTTTSPSPPGVFSRAVAHQNHQIEYALRCLAALDDQLAAEAGGNSVTSTTASTPAALVQQSQQPPRPEVPQHGGGATTATIPGPAQPAALASLALMRRLLVDAQAKFRKMVEDNKTLAQRIDGEVAAARADVGALRGELADTSRRLEELAVHPSADTDDSSPQQLQPQGGGDIEAGATTETTSPGSPTSNCRDDEDDSSCSPLEPVAGCSSDPHPARSSRPGDEGRRLREENARLRREVAELRCLLGPDSLVLSAELQSTRDALAALKADRKRLKAEKFDLLNQMKQLYGTLEDKEKELRDFIRNYEQRARETEVSAAALAAEREERERERWGLLRHARDEAERSLALAAQLTARETQLHMMQEQLMELRRQAGYSEAECRVNGTGTPPGLLVGTGMPGDRGSSADSGVRGSSDRESGATSAGGGNLSDSTTDGTPTITVEASGGCPGGVANMDMDAISLVSSIIGPHTYQSVGTPKDSPTLSPLSSNPFARMEQSSNVLSRSVEQLQQQQQGHEPPEPPRRKGAGRLGRGGTWGSISRVFARSRHRKMTSPSHDEAAAADPYRSWSPLTEEGYAEKLRLLREAASIPMERWRAPTVLAWLEIALGMPQYGPRCAENVKSGKVLLELNDAELEAGLGISHPMHRKKLRLAIEEHRHPGLVRYPCIAQLGHTWVSSEWLPDLGLAQYSENFATNMVDARMLDHLSKKELEKMLGVTRKFHQASVVHGIHLLRMIKYDRQALAVRRHQCENMDADPLVWTNQRFIRWARNIDLGEYADNLKDSGVHGALVVLEPSFSGETMATALGIPPSKNIIRRHLTTELEALILPARSAVEHYMRASKAERRRAEKLMGGGSLGRSFSRSYAGGLQREQHASAAPAPHDEELEDDDSTATSERDKGSRRSSLRSNSLLYLKKGSLSRALGLRVKQELQRQQQQLHRHHRGGEPASPESSSLASPASEGPACSFLGDSEPLGLPASSSSTSSGSARQRSHRRVRSIGDIEAASATAVTPV